MITLALSLTRIALSAEFDLVYNAPRGGVVNDKICVRKSAIHGRGVFAKQKIRRGSRIGRFEGVPTRRDGAYVLWVLGDDDEFRGIRGTTPLRFLNHSRDPNAEFRADELFALRSIGPDEEITCHYGEGWEQTEAEAAADADWAELDEELTRELDRAEPDAATAKRRSA